MTFKIIFMADREQHIYFLRKAIEIAREGMQSGKGGPFGAIVVKNGNIIGSSSNEVTSTKDPTAHAEVQAIRKACQTLDHFQLEDCILYTSCEPCPMCLGAIYWARPKEVYYAALHSDAAKVDFDDQFIYEELELSPENRSIPMHQYLQEEGIALFKEWDQMEKKIPY